MIHALESAQWLNMTSGATELTIYAGDFNTEPNSVPYRILKGIVPLNDAWAESTGDLWGGETNEASDNSFTPQSGQAKRIDYVMYRAGPGLEAETINTWFPLPNRVPGQDFSYSDHEAVAAILRVNRVRSGKQQSGPDFRRSLSLNNRAETVRAVKDANDIIDQSLRRVDSDQSKYVFYTFALVLLLVLSFIPSAFIPSLYFVAYDLALFMPRFVMTVFIVIFFLMATLFNKRERNALIGTRKELQLIQEQDLCYN